MDSIIHLELYMDIVIHNPYRILYSQQSAAARDTDNTWPLRRAANLARYASRVYEAAWERYIRVYNIYGPYTRHEIVVYARICHGCVRAQLSRIRAYDSCIRAYKRQHGIDRTRTLLPHGARASVYTCAHAAPMPNTGYTLIHGHALGFCTCTSFAC